MTIYILLSIPLLACGLTAFVPSRRWMEAIHLASTACSMTATIFLAWQVLRQGVVSSGNGFLYADPLSALVALLTAFVFLVCAPYAVGYLRRDQADGNLGPLGDAPAALGKLRMYYTLTPLFAFCMFLVVVANNLGVMWIAIEGTTLASIFLVTFYGQAHLAGSGVEVCHDRRRRPVDGALRNRSDLLLGAPGAGRRQRERS